MKKVVVFTGAGISAESGLGTFRDNGGLWDKYDIEDVATLDGWKKDRQLVLDFYNQRRKDCLLAKPNKAHFSLVDLESKFDVTVITQNIDDLHERAGSSKILHLHGEILKSRSEINKTLIYDCKEDIKDGDRCERGHQLRPHVVWFGESIYHQVQPYKLIAAADIVIVIGTSLKVYPAADFLSAAEEDKCKIYLIDPNEPNQNALLECPVKIEHIKKKATIGVPALVKKLLK